MRRAGRDVGLPVEDHRVILVADGHLGALPGPGLGQRLLHPEPGQPVAQVADRLRVAEIGLPDPPGRLVPRTTKLFSPVRTTANSGPPAAGGLITCRVGSDGGAAARAAATRRPTAKANSRTPS